MRLASREGLPALGNARRNSRTSVAASAQTSRCWLTLRRRTIILIAMGPTILLDKSTLQSVGGRGIRELGRYFYVTVPLVLALEVLADLEKAERKQRSPREEVQVLAKKLFSLGGKAFVNVDFRDACVHELLGGAVPMRRVAVVGGGRAVQTKDGRRGAYLPHQPALDAAMRWSSGQFSDSERLIASEWRARLKSFDPDSFRRSLPPLVKKATTLDDASHDVEQMLADDEGRRVFIRWLIRLISPGPVHAVIEEWAFRRWAARGYARLDAFAPYSMHCIRVMLLFHLAFANGLISTTRSSWIDAEYLCYTPFAQVFCSGDRLHRELAGFVLGDDQSFIARDPFVDDLHSLAERRALSSANVADSNHRDVVEPGEDSRIYQLHVRHLGAFRARSALQRPLSEEERQRLMHEVRPIIEAMRRDSEHLPRRTWPG
jgi:hypothetical protein